MSFNASSSPSSLLSTADLARAGQRLISACFPVFTSTLANRSLTRVQRTPAVSGFGLCLYDSLLTFSKERRHIWSKPWTVVKAMYILNRYGMLSINFYFVLSKFRRYFWPVLLQSHVAMFQLLSLSSIWILLRYVNWTMLVFLVR